MIQVNLLIQLFLFHYPREWIEILLKFLTKSLPNTNWVPTEILNRSKLRTVLEYV